MAACEVNHKNKETVIKNTYILYTVCRSKGTKLRCCFLTEAGKKKAKPLHGSFVKMMIMLETLSKKTDCNFKAFLTRNPETGADERQSCDQSLGLIMLTQWLPLHCMISLALTKITRRSEKWVRP